VGLIGSSRQIRAADDAIEMLIKGAPHNTVYSALERQRRVEVEKW